MKGITLKLFVIGAILFSCVVATTLLWLGLILVRVIMLVDAIYLAWQHLKEDIKKDRT